MKKTKLIILSITTIFLLSIQVHANTYLDITNINFNNSLTSKTLEMNGNNPKISFIKEDNENNIIIIGNYQETNSEYANNNYIIPGNNNGGINGSSGGTNVKRHAKILKLDSNYNKIWETNFYQKGNWDNAASTADTIGTTINDIIQLSDGSYIAVGYTHGLTREESSIKDDDFDAIIARFNKDGNEMYRYSYHNKGIDQAIKVEALTDGGYIIKYYTVFTKTSNGYKQPTEFEITDFNSKYYYVIYNNNNEIINYFPESQNQLLDNYNYIDINGKYNLKYTIHNTYTYKEGKKYLGTSINNESIFAEKSGNNGAEFDILKIYDAETFTEKRKIDISYLNAKEVTNLIMTNTGGFIYSNRLYDENGEVISEITEDYSMALLNGDLISISEIGNALNVNKTSNSSGDFANFIINGKKINHNIGTFVENDRTYINLNNLCSIMDCKYKRSETKQNKLIIDFDIFNNNNNKMININESSNKNINNKVKYTVVHEIGSKEYTTYLSFQPLKIFRLNSPIYKEDAVDVTSKEVDGEIYVPLRFISEALGRYVKYEPAEENNKPTITIGAYGEGSFYEKYGVAISYDNLKKNDLLTNTITENSLELKWGKEQLVYAYGYIKAENKVINIDKTIFVPTQQSLIMGAKELEYEDKDASNLSNHYTYRVFESKDNWIAKGEWYVDENGTEGDKYYGSGEYESFMIVSNIEGYPFLKIVNFK